MRCTRNSKRSAWSWATGSGLAYCYCNTVTGAFSRAISVIERQSGKKLTAALDIFTELNMPRERDAVRAELEKTE
jgi:hypothetical protein